MDATFLDYYIIISVLIALVDGVLAVKSFQKSKTTGRFLGYACVGAAVVDISYLISILNDDYIILLGPRWVSAEFLCLSTGPM